MVLIIWESEAHKKFGTIVLRRPRYLIIPSSVTVTMRRVIITDVSLNAKNSVKVYVIQ